MEELTTIDNECTRCGLCVQQQMDEGMPAIECGDLAEELLQVQALDELSPEAYEFLMSCSLCDACTAFCPQFISCAQLVRAGRKKLFALEPDLLQAYRPYRIEFRENLFPALRKAAGFSYEDYLERTPEAKPEVADEGVSLFFAGCSLSSYSERLTKTTYDYLYSQGVVQGMSVFCCGKPLRDIGIDDAFEHYTNRLVELLRAKHVTHLLVACPNCYYALSEILTSRAIEDITLEALPARLEALGLSYSGDAYPSISLHDSCPDRFDLRFSRATKALLEPSGVEMRPMESQNQDTICCGVGGLSEVWGPTLSAERRIRRLKQFAATQADCLVCSCMSCVSAFAADAEAPETRHYLELLFDTEIDWRHIALAFDRMQIDSREAFSLPPEKSTSVFDD